SSPGDARLRAESVAGELEQRSRVVVEPTDERRVDLVGDAGTVEQLADRREVGGVVGVEAVEQARRARHHLARTRIVGVERAQRIQLDALTPGPPSRLRIVASSTIVSASTAGSTEPSASIPSCQNWR